MRQVFLLLLLLLFCLPLGASQPDLFLSCDLLSLDGLWKETWNVRLEAQLALSDQFSLNLPLTLAAERTYAGSSYLEGGVFLAYRPFSRRSYLLISLVQAGYLESYLCEEEHQMLFLHEMGLGYRYAFPFGLQVDLRLTVRDPNGVFASEYEELASCFSAYEMVRLSLLVGWSFSVPSPLSKEG
nr:hypothetical protein [uncultured Sphaerochaeta sp.]